MAESAKEKAAVGDVYYGRTAEAYDKKRSSTKRWKYENDAVYCYLSQLPKRLLVLDVPFGTGRFAPYYQRYRHRVVGVDISSAMLEAARKNMDSEASSQCMMLVGDATDLKFLDDSFDIVVSVRFLQNIIPLSQVRTALREMARVSRGHGIMEVEIRKDDALRQANPAEDKPMRGQLYRHEIDQLFQTSGFNIVDVTNVYDHGESHFAILFCSKDRAAPYRENVRQNLVLGIDGLPSFAESAPVPGGRAS